MDVLFAGCKEMKNRQQKFITYDMVKELASEQAITTQSHFAMFTTGLVGMDWQFTQDVKSLNDYTEPSLNYLN